MIRIFEKTKAKDFPLSSFRNISNNVTQHLSKGELDVDLKTHIRTFLTETSVLRTWRTL